jgi:hypothetical protein
MKWTKFGQHYEREYHATGMRGDYKIDLDMPQDRWALFFNGSRFAENIYYEKSAEQIAEFHDKNGRVSLPCGLRPAPDGGTPRFLSGESIASEAISAIFESRIPIPSASAQMHAERDIESVVAKLLFEIDRHEIEPDRHSLIWSPWNSGLYSMLDAVFSAQSKYEIIVVPLLKRLNVREGMSDTTERRFSDFIRDVDNHGAEAYAVQVLNRQRVGGRLKVAVAYDCAKFLASRGYETMADLIADKEALKPIVLDQMRHRVVGIGPALSNYFLSLVGDENRIKLDVMLLRFLLRAGVTLNPSIPSDYDFGLAVFTNAATSLNSTPARLDNAIWKFESTNAA